MSGHFPFAGHRGIRYGLAPRMTISAFFEKNHFDMPAQEAYYKWWYDWAKEFVENDPDLRVTEAYRFKYYPMGQHSHHSFHLNGKYWASALDDLGSFIREVIFPKLNEKSMHELEKKHEELVKKLKTEAEERYEPAPDVGLFRHV